MAKKLLRTCVRLLRNKDGIAAVEFSLIAPFILFGMIGGGNMAITIYKHQKAVSAVNASLVLLQDKVEQEGLAAVVETPLDQYGVSQENGVQQQVKLVLKDGYGDGVTLENISLELQCACPDFSQDMQTAATAETLFYTSTSTADVNGSGQVCSTLCASSDGYQIARVVAAVSLHFPTQDIFGREITISETLNARLR